MKIFGRRFELSLSLILLGFILVILFVLFAEVRSRSEAELLTAALFTTLIVGAIIAKYAFTESSRHEEIQHLSLELSASNKRLRHLDELKTTMVAIATHQLRGALGGIRGYMTMFSEGDFGPLTEKQEEIAKLNVNVTTRLLNSVETFLDITTLEAGRLELRKEVLPFDSVVAEVVDEFRITAKKKGLELAFIVDGQRPVWADIDSEKIKHVVFNLIDNAVKFTMQGKIVVVLRCEGREAILEVADTGTGITPADARVLFGKFERGELVTDRGGAGLGLYVVKMLTELHGGRVWASSGGPGKGTTFSIALPRARL
jgi:signal transduction histidine kinase